jgi:hypothetical protein
MHICVVCPSMDKFNGLKRENHFQPQNDSYLQDVHCILLPTVHDEYATVEPRRQKRYKISLTLVPAIAQGKGMHMLQVMLCRILHYIPV